AQLERAISRRGSVILDAAANWIDFQHENRRQSSRSAGVHYRYSLSKALGLRAGYMQADSYLRQTAPRIAHYIVDAGLDFLKPLSLTRRTSLSFSFGPSMIDQNGSRQYRVVGDAVLNHEIGRTWVARASYHRGVG